MCHRWLGANGACNSVEAAQQLPQQAPDTCGTENTSAESALEIGAPANCGRGGRSRR